MTVSRGCLLHVGRVSQPVYWGMVFVALVALTLIPGVVIAENAETVPVAETEASVVEGGEYIYIDPDTGEFTAPPAGKKIQNNQLSPKMQNAFSTSHEGLVEIPSELPGGGVKLELKGRFQKGSMAMRNPDGTFSVREIEIVPEAAE